MKFEKQRITHSLSNKIQLNNQDYLTFRNSPNIENTGRTVYSQQIDWRSLQKYTSDQEIQQPKYNFKKNMRNVRSTDKYRQIQEQIGLISHDQNGQTKISSQYQKSQELKSKINMLVKNIKKAKRTQSTFDKQIQQLQASIQQNNQEIQRMNTDIQQLTQISSDNLNNYNNMLQKIQQLQEQAKDLIQKCKFIDTQINRNHQQVQTVRSRDGFNTQSYKQMLQGMKQYQQITLNLSTQTNTFQQQIYKMQTHLEQLQQLDQQIKNI